MSDFSGGLEPEFLDSLIRLHRLVGDLSPPNLGAAYGEFDGEFWRPVEHGGVLLLVVPEFAGDELVDLLAFRASDPSRVFVRTGIAAVAGEDNLRAARFLGEPLLIHATIEDYIRAGMTGCCLIDGDSMRLFDLCHIVVNDPDLGKCIAAAHRAPPPHRPTIWVRP
jgi:hypothetical protein